MLTAQCLGGEEGKTEAREGCASSRDELKLASCDSLSVSTLLHLLFLNPAWRGSNARGRIHQARFFCQHERGLNGARRRFQAFTVFVLIKNIEKEINGLKINQHIELLLPFKNN